MIAFLLFLRPLLFLSLLILRFNWIQLSPDLNWYQLLAMVLSAKTEIPHSFFISVVLLVFLLSFLLVALILFFKNRITNLKQEEEIRLQQFKYAIEREERARIAADLHDGVCSDLSALLNFMNLLKQNKKTDELDHILADIELCIHNAMDTTRIISHNLMPAKFAHNNLIEILKNHARLTNSSSTVKFRVIAPDQNIRLSKNVSYEIFRIIQELTQNMIKHGKVTTIKLLFKINHGQLLIQIFNNGIPFDGFKKKPQTNGIGLQCIKMRLEKITATIQNKFTQHGNLTELKIPLSL